MAEKYVTVDEFEQFKKMMEEKFSESKEEPKEEKVKKVKAPKPPSKYNLFMKEKFEELKAQHPEMTAKDMMKKVGELWKLEKDKESSTQ